MGSDQLVYAVEDIKRAVALGIRSVLVADIGLLAVVGEMKKRGDLPGGLIVKTSVMMAPANPASARVLEDLGATTINVPSDLTLRNWRPSARRSMRRSISTSKRRTTSAGFIRYYETPSSFAAGAPLYVKLGLKNARTSTPAARISSPRLSPLSRERVRRARIVHDVIRRYAPHLRMSPRP